jgi:hypothetical protein
MSDSHGSKDTMLKAVAYEVPDLILHLGDHDKDCLEIEWNYPEIPIRTVRGNCDRSSAGLDEDEFTLAGKRFYMTHGHLFSVKTGKSTIISYAASRGIDVLLFGHTHIPMSKIQDNITIINPGSIASGEKTYAILELKDGVVLCDVKSAKLLGKL